mgnify:FL=1
MHGKGQLRIFVDKSTVRVREFARVLLACPYTTSGARSSTWQKIVKFFRRVRQRVRRVRATTCDTRCLFGSSSLLIGQHDHMYVTAAITGVARTCQDKNVVVLAFKTVARVA